MISGQESGYCDLDMNPINAANGKRIKNSMYKLVNMPFCGRYIPYVPCVPKYPMLEPDRNYPIGRWYNFTILQKDEWVRLVRGNINYRIDLETTENGKTLEDMTRFQDAGLQQAYIKYMCWINFPKYDNDLESVRTCESSCLNFSKHAVMTKTCGVAGHRNGSMVSHNHGAHLAAEHDLYDFHTAFQLLSGTRSLYSGSNSLNV